MRRTLIISVLALLPSQTAAQTVPVPAFEAVQLRGGGEVIVRHGPVQRVTVLEGSTSISRLEVEGPSNQRRGENTFQDDGRRLVISACERRCPQNYKLRVEIVTPKLAGLAINGGGRITSAGRFPQQEAIGLAVRGGGLLDARSLPASSVGAAISGGGVINTSAVRALGASVAGGGAVRYWGNPTTTVNIAGGGTVTRADGKR
jgi:hypothetical protein